MTSDREKRERLAEDYARKWFGDQDSCDTACSRGARDGYLACYDARQKEIDELRAEANNAYEILGFAAKYVCPGTTDAPEAVVKLVNQLKAENAELRSVVAAALILIHDTRCEVGKEKLGGLRAFDELEAAVDRFYERKPGCDTRRP